MPEATTWTKLGMFDSYEYRPTAPYVLSEPGPDYEHAIIRTENGEVLGTDGWQQMGCVEDATFTRDLSWILPELNHQAQTIEAQRATLRAIEALGCAVDAPWMCLAESDDWDDLCGPCLAHAQLAGLLCGDDIGRGSDDA